MTKAGKRLIKSANQARDMLIGETASYVPDTPEVVALRERVAELEGALKPFAEAEQHLEINEKTKNRSIWAQMHQKPGCSQEYKEITYSHIGNAAATLNKERN